MGPSSNRVFSAFMVLESSFSQFRIHSCSSASIRFTNNVSSSIVIFSLSVSSLGMKSSRLESVSDCIIFVPVIWTSLTLNSDKCYDLVTFGGKSSQSFVSSFSLLLILFKFLFRTFENESEEVVNCWVQSSAKEFDYSIYSFILLIRVII